jgi:Cu/Ag efflux pump CusA
MDLEPYYDRGNLVKLTTHTVLENLIVGMVLVAIVLIAFLGHARAALITALNIPLALLIAFCGLVGTHTSANLISLGAVDFGIVVDSTVIMMENIFRHLGAHGKGTMIERIEQSAREVATPMTFSTLIIGVAFLPLFTMTGVSGVIFAPMARTYAFAIGGAICLALTLTPAFRGEGERGHARPAQGLQSGLRPRDAVSQGRRGLQPTSNCHVRNPLSPSGSRIHASPGRRQFLDPRDVADVDLA